MINVFRPKLTLNNILSVFRALLKNEISGTSQVVKDFENNLAQQFDRKHSVAVSNGSTALEVALQLLNLEKGDEVIVPSFTIISCLNAVIRTKATPVFCDVDFETWNMGIEDVKKAYSKNTKAVIMVHTYGLTSEAIEIEKFCKSNSLKLIEDSAEAHGQTVDGRKCGSFGDISTLSFYANKHITSGEGGALLTNDEMLIKEAQQMINLDFNQKNRFIHNNYYWNYRLGGLQAALANSQIKELNKTINKKIKQGLNYIELFKKYSVDVNLPLARTERSENHFWVFGIILKSDYDRDKIMEDLFKLKIETRPFFWPLSQQPPIKKSGIRILPTPNSEKLGMNGFYIPMGKHVTKRLQKKIVLTIKECLIKEQSNL